jgi:hypothetical protein
MTPIAMSNPQNRRSCTTSSLTAVRVRMADQRQKTLQRTYASERYDDPKDSEAAKALLLARIPKGARHVELIHLEPGWQGKGVERLVLWTTQGQHAARWVA